MAVSTQMVTWKVNTMYCDRRAPVFRRILQKNLNTISSEFF